MSSIITNLFMEWLEEQAILKSPITYKSKLWNVDDVMEVVSKGCERELTEHLNSIDTTASTKFTYDEESDNSLPFMDKLMTRKEDGTVKLLVYRKKTHTDQCINFTSQYPIHQKMGVIKTIMDRCITKALNICGYSSWTIKKMKEQQFQKGKTKEKKEKNIDKSKGMVTLPYVKRVA